MIVSASKNNLHGKQVEGKDLLSLLAKNEGQELSMGDFSAELMQELEAVQAPNIEVLTNEAIEQMTGESVPTQGKTPVDLEMLLAQGAAGDKKTANNTQMKNINPELKLALEGQSSDIVELAGMKNMNGARTITNPYQAKENKNFIFKNEKVNEAKTGEQASVMTEVGRAPATEKEDGLKVINQKIKLFQQNAAEENGAENFLAQKTNNRLEKVQQNVNDEQILLQANQEENQRHPVKDSNKVNYQLLNLIAGNESKETKTADKEKDELKIKELNSSASNVNSGRSVLSLIEGKVESNKNVDMNAATASSFDMKKLSSDNRDSVLQQVNNYIVQSNVSNKPQVNMSFIHESLGKVDIMVQKRERGTVAIEINSAAQEGKLFFGQHQQELLQSLAQSGVKVSEFKLDSQTSGSFDQSGQFNQSQRQFNQSGFAENRQQDSKRRSELWDILRESREAA